MDSTAAHWPCFPQPTLTAPWSACHHDAAMANKICHILKCVHGPHFLILHMHCHYCITTGLHVL